MENKDRNTWCEIGTYVKISGDPTVYTITNVTDTLVDDMFLKPERTKDEYFEMAIDLWLEYYDETKQFDLSHPSKNQYNLRNRNAYEQLHFLNKRASERQIPDKILNDAKKYVLREIQ